MLPLTTLQNISPFHVSASLLELWFNDAFGRYYLPNGEIFNLTSESIQVDFANAQSRCVIIYILLLK